LNCITFVPGVRNITEGEKMRLEGNGFSLIEILIVMGVLSFLAIVFTA
jgi:prepilin-type N-terminal cleavage/methylation domain-containing protein